MTDDSRSYIIVPAAYKEPRDLDDEIARILGDNDDAKVVPLVLFLDDLVKFRPSIENNQATIVDTRDGDSTFVVLPFTEFCAILEIEFDETEPGSAAID